MIIVPSKADIYPLFQGKEQLGKTSLKYHQNQLNCNGLGKTSLFVDHYDGISFKINNFQGVFPGFL